MFRRFLKDSAIYSIGGILSRAISLLLLPFYTRVLSPAEYGVIDLLTVFGALANVTVALEISQGLARFFPESSTRRDREEWASTAFWFTAGAMLLFAAVCFAFARPISAVLLDSPELAPVFSLSVVSIVLNGIFYLAQVQLRWERKAGQYTTASLVYTLGSIAATIVFVLLLRLGVTGVMLGQISGFVMGAGLAAWYARANYRFAFSSEKCRQMLAFSLPFVPSSLAVFVSAWVDRLAIKTLMQLEDVGIYGIAYRLASPIALLTIGFQGALTPLIVANYREPATPATIARIFRYFLVVALFGCVAVSVLAREVLAIFAAPRFAPAAGLVPLLAPAVLLPTMYVFAPGLFLSKKTGSAASVTILTAILNTVLNFALIPILGTHGSALATMSSAMLAFAVFMALSQRHYPVPHPWPVIALAVGGCVATILAGAAVPLAGLRDFRGVAIHTLLVGAAAVWLPIVLLGGEEIRMIARRGMAVLATSRIGQWRP